MLLEMWVITFVLLRLCLKVVLCTAIMAAWVHPGMAAVPAEITEEKLQEKGKCRCYDMEPLVALLT